MNRMPELTEREKKLGNTIASMLKERTYTKQELMQIFNISERTVRHLISEIAKRRPIISISGGKGYRMANGSLDDVLLCKRQWAEHDSRAEQILMRTTPLRNEVEKFISNKGITLGELGILEGLSGDK